MGHSKRPAWLHSRRDQCTGDVRPLFRLFSTTSTHERLDHATKACHGCDSTTSSDPIYTPQPTCGFQHALWVSRTSPWTPSGPAVNFDVNRSGGFVPPGMSTATFVRSEKPMTRPFVTGSDTCTSGSKPQGWRRAAKKRLAWSEKRAASRRWKNPKAPKTSHPHVPASCKTCVPISSNVGSVGQGLDLPFPSDWI